MPPTSKRAPKPPKQYINRRLRRVDGGALGTFLPYCAKRVWTCSVVSPVDGFVSRRLYNSLEVSLCHSSCESSSAISSFSTPVFPICPFSSKSSLIDLYSLSFLHCDSRLSRSNSTYRERYIGGRAVPRSTDREDSGLQISLMTWKQSDS